MRIVFSVALFIIALTATAEQQPMNTLISISEQVAKEVAKPDLVADFNGGDFTPTPTFLRLINAAHRHLDRRRQHQNPRHVARIPLVQGQYFADLPSTLKYITRVDLEDENGKILPYGGLRRSTIEHLRDEYRQRFDLVGQGVPCEWARNVPGSTLEGANLFTNGEFDSELTPWTYNSFYTDPSVAFGQVTVKNKLISTGPDVYGVGAGLVYTFDAPIDARGTTLSLDVVSLTNAKFFIRLVGETYTVTFAHVPSVDEEDEFIYITDPGTYTFDMDAVFQSLVGRVHNTGIGNFTAAELDEMQRNLVGVELVLNSVTVPAAPLTAVLDNVSLHSTTALGELVFLPPADKPYTLVVEHAAYAPEMVSPTDVTWWSTHDLHILILAIKRQIEQDIHRNRQGVKDYDEDIETALFDIERDEIDEAQQGPSNAQRLGYRADPDCGRPQRPRWRLGGD